MPELAFEEKLRAYGLEYFGKYYSVYKGTVADNVDPQSQGRVKVRVPALGRDDELEKFAYPILPFAGPRQGFFFPPEVGDHVWVVFEGGNPTQPRYFGGWWRNPSKSVSGSDVPPTSNPRGDAPQIRELRTKAGHRIVFDDGKISSGITIQTPKGNLIRLKDDDGKIEIISVGDVRVQGQEVKVEATSAVVESATADIRSPQIKINNGTKVAAAIGDTTVGSPSTHTITGPPVAGRPLIP